MFWGHEEATNPVAAAAENRVHERILGAEFQAFTEEGMPVTARSISQPAPKSRNVISMRILPASMRCSSLHQKPRRGAAYLKVEVSG
jgi:hypothetical protein